MEAANHTASTTGGFEALAGTAAKPGQDGVENVVEKPGNRVAAAGGSSISANLGHNLLQNAGSECRSQEGSRGNYGQYPAIKEHIKLSGRRGK